MNFTFSHSGEYAIRTQAPGFSSGDFPLKLIDQATRIPITSDMNDKSLEIAVKSLETSIERYRKNDVISLELCAKRVVARIAIEKYLSWQEFELDENIDNSSGKKSDFIVKGIGRFGCVLLGDEEEEELVKSSTRRTVEGYVWTRVEKNEATIIGFSRNTKKCEDKLSLNDIISVDEWMDLLSVLENKCAVTSKDSFGKTSSFRDFSSLKNEPYTDEITVVMPSANTAGDFSSQNPMGLNSPLDFSTIGANQLIGLSSANAPIALNPLTVGGVLQSNLGGFFTVGSAGKVSIDYLYDGGWYEGEVAFVSLTGMEDLIVGSQAFFEEAGRRAVSNSALGHIAISDVTEGARFSAAASVWESDYNHGVYAGPKSFAMNPGDRFMTMMTPNSTFADWLRNPVTDGNPRPLFSLAYANPDSSKQVGQIADVDGRGNTFVMEDVRTDVWSDRDYNDIIFQVLGAVGSAVKIGDVIDVDMDWRETSVGKDLLRYIVLDKSKPLIGIIDTGLAASNPDIDPYRIHLGRDYVAGDANPLLQPGTGSQHGTFITGIIAATVDNGIGIDGLTSADTPIYVARAIGSGGWAQALRDFVDYSKEIGQPRAIVNLSFDLTQTNADGTITTTRYELTPTERGAIEYARQNNVLIVAAAGNTGGTMSALGQASQEFDNIITVGSLDESDRRTSYSGYGYGLDIMAYGGTIEKPVVSTVGSGTDLQKIIDSLNQQWGGGINSSTQDSTDQGTPWLIDGLPSTTTPSQESAGSISTTIDISDLADDEMSINAKDVFNDVFGQFPDSPDIDSASLTPEEREVYENATQEIDKLLSAYLGDASKKIALEYVDGLYANQVNALSQFVEAFDDDMAETLIKAQNILEEAGYAVQLPQDQSAAALDLGVGTMAGTSVATARATGIASQIWASNPGLTYDQIKDILKKSATDLGVPGWDPQTGVGKINLADAISLAQTTQPSDRKPQPIISPLIWSGEGSLLPGERAVSYTVPAFTGNILNAGYVTQVGFLRIRSGPGQNFTEVRRLNPGTSVVFDAVEDNGGFVSDPYMPGGGSSRWYRIAGTNNWMSGLYLDNTPEQAAQERQRIEAIQKAEEEARKASLALTQAEEEARKAEEELRRIEAEQKQEEEEIRIKREQFKEVVNIITQNHGDPGLLLGNWVSNGVTVYQFNQGQLIVQPNGIASFYTATKNQAEDIIEIGAAKATTTLLNPDFWIKQGLMQGKNIPFERMAYEAINPGTNGFVIPRFGSPTFSRIVQNNSASKLLSFVKLNENYIDNFVVSLSKNPQISTSIKNAKIGSNAIGIAIDLALLAPDLLFEGDEKKRREKAINGISKAAGAALFASIGTAMGGPIGGIAGGILGGIAGDFVGTRINAGVDYLTPIISDGWNKVSVLVDSSLDAMKKSAEQKLQQAKELVDKAKSAAQSAQSTVQQAKVTYQAVKQEIAVRTTQIVQQAQQKMQEEARAVVQQVINNPVVKATASKVIRQVATYAKQAVQGVTNIINSVKQFVGNVVETGKQIVNNVIETAKQSYETVKTFVVEKVEQGKQFVAEQYHNATKAVSDTWNNVSNGFSGLKSMFGW
jgi:hypothetical protein